MQNQVYNFLNLLHVDYMLSMNKLATVHWLNIHSIILLNFLPVNQKLEKNNC